MNREIIAYILMGIGALLALIAASGPLGSSIGFQFFFVFSLLLLTVAVLLRKAIARDNARRGTAHRDVELAHEALHELDRSLEELCSYEASFVSMKAYHEKLEQKAERPLHTFVEHSQELIDAYRFADFAQLMIGFAQVERSIHRALSASADGVGVEAQRCVAQARDKLKQLLVFADTLSAQNNS